MEASINLIISMQRMLEKKQYDEALEYTNQITQRLGNVLTHRGSDNIA